jgi:prepilin-type N-terminal cleavage/methylation domain-containing protein
MRRTVYLHIKSGFTIVELLIVIVVIAILAAISIVAFTGIQDQAQNTKILSTVDSYTKALELYYAKNNHYPDYGPTWGACLGEPSDYPAENGWPAGACTTYTSGTGEITHDYAYQNFHDELLTIVDNLPQPKIREITETYQGGSSTKYRGIYFESTQSADHKNDWAYVEYVIKGDQTCPHEYVKRYNQDQKVTFCSRIIGAYAT